MSEDVAFCDILTNITYNQVFCELGDRILLNDLLIDYSDFILIIILIFPIKLQEKIDSFR